MKTPAVALEVCLDSLESALAARRGGADRIELCSAIDAGGLTPSIGVVRAVRRASATTLHVLVRPRAGDFAYSRDELRLMIDDILAVKDAGADGVVIGALTGKGALSVRATERLVAAARPMSVTFHRAFDQAGDRAEALEALVGLGVERVLTSGGAARAWSGRTVIAGLVRKAAGRIAVMAGGGIEAATAGRLVEETGVFDVHVSSGVSIARRSGQGAYAAEVATVDARKVAAMAAAMRRRR